MSIGKGIISSIYKSVGASDKGMEHLKLMVTFDQLWEDVKDVVDMRYSGKRVEAVRSNLRYKKKPFKNILDAVTEGDIVKLRNGEMQFPDPHSLWTVMNEILVNEDYYFETEAKQPRILDCGTHFGMALYYYKTLFPNSIVTGFEPFPTMRAMATRNMERNGFKDVTIEPYAISGEPGKATFHVSKTFSMAGSLTDRRVEAGDEVEEINVEVKTLREYLQEEVNFLKLDIEGSEYDALFGAADSLHNVENIFIEYHHETGENAGRLGEILNLLHEKGFAAHVSKSFSFGTKYQRKPIQYVGSKYSAIIWGKNTKWKS